MEPLVSICIASYRRPRGLARLLDSLDELEIPDGVAVEIIVVDNDAAASARALVAGRAPVGPPLSYLVEPRRNIALARNRALSAARGRWLAFIDDDEVAERGWLAAYLEAAGRRDADAFFGPVLPRFEGGAPSWLASAGFFERPRHPSGAVVGVRDARTGNAFVARKLFEGREFDAGFGRGGEDAEFFARAGGVFVWCDEARVLEWLPPERQRLPALTRRAFRGGTAHSRIALCGGRRGARVRGVTRALLAAAACAVLLPAAALCGRAPAARAWLRLCVQAGHLWAFAGCSRALGTA